MATLHDLAKLNLDNIDDKAKEIENTNSNENGKEVLGKENNEVEKEVLENTTENVNEENIVKENKELIEDEELNSTPESISESDEEIPSEINTTENKETEDKDQEAEKEDEIKNEVLHVKSDDDSENTDKTIVVGETLTNKSLTNNLKELNILSTDKHDENSHKNNNTTNDTNENAAKKEDEKKNTMESTISESSEQASTANTVQIKPVDELDFANIKIREHEIERRNSESNELIEKSLPTEQKQTNEKEIHHKIHQENIESIQNNEQEKVQQFLPSQQQQEYSTIQSKEQQYNEKSTICYDKIPNINNTQQEAINVNKHIDLQKIFTPATDGDFIIPKSRKLYASSAFYSPTLHPTVEDQVELARRISHSLSDISNDQSKGQSMYVNRKKRSVKWIHEGHGDDNEQHKNYIPTKPCTSPNLLPAYSDVGKHRVQLNMHQEQLLQKYVKPELKVVKSPWEAALETGSASTAFVESPKPSVIIPPASLPPPTQHTIDDYKNYHYKDNNFQQNYKVQSPQEPLLKKDIIIPSTRNYSRELAYKPNVPQGWKSAGVSLPTELYVPPEISLKSYAPPPVFNLDSDRSNIKSNLYASIPLSQNDNSLGSLYDAKPYTTTTTKISCSSPFKEAGPQYKQQCFSPTSYQKIPRTVNSPPQVNFQPSPISLDKLAKFEQNNANSSNAWIPPYQAQSKAYSHFSVPVENFNNSARGWHSPQLTQFRSSFPVNDYHKSKISCNPKWIENNNSLPYTDF